MCKSVLPYRLWAFEFWNFRPREPKHPVKKRQPWRSPDTWRRHVHSRLEVIGSGIWSKRLAPFCVQIYRIGPLPSIRNSLKQIHATTWLDLIKLAGISSTISTTSIVSIATKWHNFSSLSIAVLFWLRVLAGGTVLSASLPVSAGLSTGLQMSYLNITQILGI